MNVLVAGGHGQIALRLLGLLAERGDQPRGLIRDPRQADDLRAVGAEPVLADLETDDLTPHLHSTDAFVFSAGAGGGSPERTLAVDRDAAIRAIGAAQAAHVRRWVMVSSIWAHDPTLAPQSLRHYMQAKAAADSALSTSGLDWTIVRPGLLTDEPGTGTVRTSTKLGGHEPVSRDDVALVLAECLHQPATIGKTFELFDGTDPVTEALESLQAES